MSLPIALAVAYLAVNVVVMLWIEWQRAHGHAPASRLWLVSNALRYGPPLAGFMYLVTIAGDWLFFGFVIAFFAGAFWLMDGLLSYNPPGGSSEPMRRGWDERGAGRRATQDRDTAS
jgi:hypothetical protein